MNDSKQWQRIDPTTRVLARSTLRRLDLRHLFIVSRKVQLKPDKCRVAIRKPLAKSLIHEITDSRTLN